jgi:hypothetical protein
MATSPKRPPCISAASSFAAALALGLLASTVWHGSADAYAYRTARGLYQDCAAPARMRNGVPTVQRERCNDYLEQALNAWNLNQDNGICSRHSGAALPDAYVRYWKARGLGVLKGEFTSAEASVYEFLDSQRQRCPAAAHAAGS